MSSVFRNIDHPTPSSPGECLSPRLWCGGRTHSLGGDGVEEDARHCSVLCICKYFVGNPHAGGSDGESLTESPATGSTSGSQTTPPSDAGARESGDGILDRKARET
jgi:hypothetical protein